MGIYMALAARVEANAQNVHFAPQNPEQSIHIKRGWLEFESVGEGLNVYASVAHILGGVASLCTGNLAPAIIMFVSSGLHLQGAENCRLIHRMVEIEGASLRLQRTERELRGDIQVLQGQNDNLRGNNAALAAEVARVTQAAAELRAQNANLNNRNEELRALIQNGDQTLRARYQEFYELGAQMTITKNSLQESARRFEQNEERAAAAQVRLNISTQRLENIERQIIESTQRLREQTERTVRSMENATQRLDTLSGVATPKPTAPSLMDMGS